MDVPAWHPANQDSESFKKLFALKNDAATKRTEFKVMPGSMADTSTEAGRQLAKDLGDGGGAAYEGRGFFDTSDRLYLIEQQQIDRELEAKRQHERDEALRQFRSNALKVQATTRALDPALLVAQPTTQKKPNAAKSGVAEPLATSKVGSVVVVKSKKRIGGDLESRKQKITKCGGSLRGEMITRSCLNSRNKKTRIRSSSNSNSNANCTAKTTSSGTSSSTAGLAASSSSSTATTSQNPLLPSLLGYSPSSSDND